MGEQLQAFEAAFARYCDVPFSIGVANGLDALTLILEGLGIGSGDEVIVPAHTFIATWLAVSRVGAVPVPADCDAATGNIDSAAVARAVTARTKAVMAVHLSGNPADLAGLLAVTRRYHIQLIDDAAQANGRSEGRRGGEKVGS